MASLLAAEWPDLPPTGPATVDAVKSDLRINDDTDDVILQRIVTGVNRKVRRWPIAAYAQQPAITDPGDRVWPDDIIQGAVMLCGRLYRRRNSPAGFESFGVDGAVYVQRNDPDIAQMLEIGSWMPPAVG